MTLSAVDYAGNTGSVPVTFTVQAQISTGGRGAGGRGGTGGTTGGSTGGTAPPPKLGSLGSVATDHEIEKGLTATLTELKPKSKVSLTIRSGSKALTTFKATASRSGAVKVKFHLSKKLAAKYRGKKLTLRFTVTDAEGHKHTLTKTLQIS